MLSVPIAFSRMSTMLMGFTDAVMLSNYATNELPYILNAWLPVGIAFAMGLGILQGVQVITSELVGVNKSVETGRVLRRGLAFGLILGLVTTFACILTAAPLFNLLSFEGELRAGTIRATEILAYGLVGHMLSMAAMLYLEALHKQKIVTFILFLGVFVNVLFDLIMVKGMFGIAPMGADGVAWATTLSRYLIVVGLAIAVIFCTPALKRVGSPPADEMGRQFTVGLGATLSQVAEFSAFNFTFVIATWVSIEAASAYGMTINVAGLCFMLFLGIATATSVQTAEAFGQKNYLETVLSSRAGLSLGLAIAIMISVGLFLLNDALAKLIYAYAPDTDGVPLTLFASLLGLSAFMIIGDGLQVIGAYALRAMDIVWTPGFVHLGSFYVIMVPMGYMLALPMGYGVHGLMAGVIMGCVTAGFLQVLTVEYVNYRRLKSI